MGGHRRKVPLRCHTYLHGVWEDSGVTHFERTTPYCRTLAASSPEEQIRADGPFLAAACEGFALVEACHLIDR